MKKYYDITIKDIKAINENVLYLIKRFFKIDTRLFFNLNNNLSSFSEVIFSSELEGIFYNIVEKEKIEVDKTLLDLAKSIYANKAIKESYFDNERKKIVELLDNNKVDYVLLKGIIIQDFYPCKGIRGFNDNDILIDASKRENVRNLMDSLGYHLAFPDEDTHDERFVKPPYLAFEMHNYLIPENYPGYEYFMQIWDRVEKCENDSHEYKMTLEDFYLFFICHNEKHWDKSGLGIRAFIDNYLFISQYSDSVNWKYVEKNLNEFGVSEFYNWFKDFTEMIFYKEDLSDRDNVEIYKILSSGIFGSDTLRYEHMYKKVNNSVLYVLYRLFPNFEYMKSKYKILKKYPFLLLIMYVYRWGETLLFPTKAINEVKSVRHFKNIDK